MRFEELVLLEIFWQNLVLYISISGQSCSAPFYMIFIIEISMQ